MSLFSRLRARDSQDNSKEEETAADSGKGGLFGSVQLKPAKDEPNVPPPAASGMTVPSLEEARAELDRIRAQNAHGEKSSGLFRRDKLPADELESAAPHAPVDSSATRESTTFGAVSLPPRAADAPISSPAHDADETPIAAPLQSTSWQEEDSQTPAAPTTLPVQSPVARPVAHEAIEDVPPGETPFRVPALSQFTDAEDAPAQLASQPAPAPATPPALSVEQTVYAPIAPESRRVIEHTEPQITAPQDIVSTVESLRSVEIQSAPNDASVSRAEDLPGAVSAPRLSNTPNMTPFQRLMAARAAQGGSPSPRPRIERPAPIAEAPLADEAPVADTEAAQGELPREIASLNDGAHGDATETSGVSAPEVAPVASEVQAAQAEIEQPQFEVPQGETPQPTEPQIEVPQIELDEQAPQIAVPSLDSPPVLSDPVAVAALDLPVPLDLPQSHVSQIGEEVEAPPLVQDSPLPPENGDEAGDSAISIDDVPVGEASVTESAAPMPEIEALQKPHEAAMSQDTEPQISQIEALDLQAEAFVAQGTEEKIRPSEDASWHNESPAETAAEEAEIVPEEIAAATASPDVEPFSEMPTPETAEPPARPALSLSERLARAPRAELDAAHAEAEALTPEILENAVPIREVSAPNPAPARSTSFAERLAARNKPQVEPPIPATAPVAAPVEPSFAQPTVPDIDEESGESAPESSQRSAPRSFSERLAARTGLDRHLQVPAPESSPTSQDLAPHNTELARISVGAELSERELKNRVLFRQKHLIFDSVIGSLDQRTMQNPTRDSVKPQLEKGVDAALREYGLDLEQSERNWLVDEFVREVTDLGALVPMLEDPSVSKIVVTGANDVSVERLGRIERTGVSFRDDDHLLSLVRRIAELSGGRVDAKVPLLDRPLPDGGRIRAKVPPLAPQPTLTIEKSTGNPFVVLKRQIQEKSRGDSLPYAQLRERIQQRLLREFEGDAAALAGDQDKLRLQVEEMIGSVIAEEHVAVTRAERASLVMDLLNEIVGLGPIEPLLNDPDVDEVMVNGPYQIYVERKGKLELTSQRFRDNAHVMQVIDRIVAPLGRRVDEKSPMVDGRLRDGSRFNAIIPPLALSGPTMTIRKFARDPFTMSDLINFGTITREAAQFLQAAVEGRLNVVVSGGTGSGKTTTLNVLSSFIPSTERIVTIEDAAELQMRQEHVIRMETRPPNIEGVGEVSIRDLVKNSLRMRPDRIVVGECRGGEALDMLQAMNTGHDGSLTTAHSNGPRDTCKRLETMVMMAGFDLPVRAIREQISMAVQLVVHQERMRDGKRRVTAITEIVGMEGDVLTMQDIFRFEHAGMDDDGRLLGSLQATGMRPKYYETMVDNGVQLSMDIFTPKVHEAAPRARLNERGGR